jgi:hypothetical protein
MEGEPKEIVMKSKMGLEAHMRRWKENGRRSQIEGGQKPTQVNGRRTKGDCKNEIKDGQDSINRIPRKENQRRSNPNKEIGSLSKEIITNQRISAPYRRR